MWTTFSVNNARFRGSRAITRVLRVDRPSVKIASKAAASLLNVIRVARIIFVNTKFTHFTQNGSKSYCKYFNETQLSIYESYCC